jgi:hypothetical protein
MGEPGGQNPRLAGAGARQHQERAILGEHGCLLLVVQPMEISRSARPPACGVSRHGFGMNHHRSSKAALFPRWCRSSTITDSGR